MQPSMPAGPPFGSRGSDSLRSEQALRATQQEAMSEPRPVEIIPPEQYGKEYSEAWEMDVFCVTNSQGEKYYLHAVNITVEGAEVATLAFRRQIRYKAQSRLPDGYRVIESTNGLPVAQPDPELGPDLTFDDFEFDG